MRGDRARHFVGEPVAIHRERGAGGDAREVGSLHHHGPQPPHLLFQQTNSVIELVAAEGIAADELGKPIGLVDRGRPHRTHFVDGDRNPERSGLPGGFASGKPPAYDVNHDQSGAGREPPLRWRQFL